MNKLVAMFGVKYEPEWMVKGLIENLKGWVDDFAIMDCRGRKDELWMHEGDYRLALREKAREMKADWVLMTSPDERWEKNAGNIIRPMINENKGQKIYEFDLRELFHPMWYRNDGLWANKTRQRLYPLFDDQIMKYQPIQCHGVPVGGYEVIHLPVNIYHLKMIEKENRKKRVEVFKALDPNSIYQKEVGYDYLDNEIEAVVVRIPEGREYLPMYDKKYEFRVPEHFLKHD